MKPYIERASALIFAAALLLCAAFAHAQTVSPFMALGNAQFFDNNGNLLTSGVLYSYQAGTTTQQATYVDYTGTVLNPNPIPFGSGARVAIWLTSTASYKFVLCQQNDGAFCAPSDILFSIDHVPGCLSCSTLGNIFTGTFISGTANPATTGILELASIDSICWRNAAGNANLCISKDTSDVLTWTGPTIKLPEASCVIGAINADYLCPNAATHHLSANNNNTGYGSLPVVVTAGISGHLAGLATNGIDLLDSGGTPPASTAVTFSATPTFTATSQDQLFTMTLTGNVTGSTLVMTSLPVPSLVSFVLTQDATGGRTFAWPMNVLGAVAPAPAPSAVTTQEFVWDGTNARALTTATTPSFYPPQRVVLSANVPMTASTNTTILTETVTFPSTAGTYRADMRYGIYVIAGANVCVAGVVDTTNSTTYALSGQNSAGNGDIALSGSEISSHTYAAGSTATFIVQASCNNGGGGLTGATVNANIVGLSPAESSYLSVTPILSN
jgi:hypothetical protein